MNKKIALILSGGGMAASYNFGALLALVEKYQFISPDIVITGSGSAGTASYYIAGQHNSNIWGDLLSTKKFINFLRFWKIIDIDYLIDEIFKKQDPLQSEKIYQSKINYLIAVTNNISGRVNYFSNKDQIDIFELMRATKAIPLFYGRQIRIKDEYYTDGVNSTAAAFNLQQAFELGADKVIIISCNKKLNNFLFKFWLFFKSKKYQQGISADFNKRSVLENQENVLLIKPKLKLKIGILSNKQKNIRETIRLGYDDVFNSLEVQDFFRNL